MRILLRTAAIPLIYLHLFLPASSDAHVHTYVDPLSAESGASLVYPRLCTYRLWRRTSGWGLARVVWGILWGRVCGVSSLGSDGGVDGMWWEGEGGGRIAVRC